jgi:alpha-L-fucosidase
MTKFEENNPEQLKEFLKQLNELVDEFHPNIYLMDDVSEALEKIDKAIKKELSK